MGKENRFDPNNAEERKKVASDGYTIMEKYLNSFVEIVTAKTRSRLIVLFNPTEVEILQAANEFLGS